MIMIFWMNSSYLCTCPQCHHSGALLSSIRKSETWLYSKNGHYGRILQTERAHMFKEPQKKDACYFITYGFYYNADNFDEIPFFHNSKVGFI